jgi:hypothetical protein
MCLLSHSTPIDHRFGSTAPFSPSADGALLSRGRKSAVLDGLQCEDMIARGGGNRCEENPLMRTHMPALAMIALVGFCSQANAQARCPELTRLRSEAAEALKQARGVPSWGRCEAYNRFSRAWGAIAEYANDQRELCDISTLSLNEIEKDQREAVKTRDNACAGRPLRPFPPDIILH